MVEPLCTCSTNALKVFSTNIQVVALLVAIAYARVTLQACPSILGKAESSLIALPTSTSNFCYRLNDEPSSAHLRQNLTISTAGSATKVYLDLELAGSLVLISSGQL